MRAFHQQRGGCLSHFWADIATVSLFSRGCGLGQRWICLSKRRKMKDDPRDRELCFLPCVQRNNQPRNNFPACGAFFFWGGCRPQKLVLVHISIFVLWFYGGHSAIQNSTYFDCILFNIIEFSCEVKWLLLTNFSTCSNHLKNWRGWETTCSAYCAALLSCGHSVDPCCYCWNSFPKLEWCQAPRLSSAVTVYIDF